jgi:hypothetical protein
MEEIRIPNKLLSTALAQKQTKALRLLAAAKLDGHRSEIAPLLGLLKIHPKTGSRLIKNLVDKGWAGTDGTYIFPRSWRKLKFSKRGGLYLTTAPTDIKRFEAVAFAKGLKSLYRRKGSPRPGQRRAKQKDFPTGFLCAAMGLKERRFKTLKAAAQRYKYIAVIPQYSIIGAAKDYPVLKKNIHGPPVFKRGKHTVVPDVSKIRVLI